MNRTSTVSEAITEDAAEIRETEISGDKERDENSFEFYYEKASRNIDDGKNKPANRLQLPTSTTKNSNLLKARNVNKR